MLTVSTSDLDLVLVGDSVEGILITHQLWQIDVNGCSHGGTKVGWARSDVTKMRVVSEFNDRFNMGGGSAESLEDSCDVSSWLHRNNSELILLIDPDKESLGVVVENTSAGWPVSVKTARFEEFVTFLEEEMIGNELVLILLAHTLKRIELSFEVTFEGLASLNNFGHDIKSLCLANTWTEWVPFKVSSDSDSRGVDHGALLFGEVSVLKTLSRHFGHVLGTWSVLMIVLNDLVEKLIELGVGIVGASIHTNTRFLVSNT